MLLLLLLLLYTNFQGQGSGLWLIALPFESGSVAAQIVTREELSPFARSSVRRTLYIKPVPMVFL